MMYTGAVYIVPDTKKDRRIKVDFDDVWSIQLRYNIEAYEAVVQYLYDRYHRLFPKLGSEIFDKICADYRPYEQAMYDLGIYDWM